MDNFTIGKSRFVARSWVTLGLIVGALIGTLGETGCSNLPWSGDSAKDIAPNGPTVLNERFVPKTIELNRDLQPMQSAQVLADVKDFKSNINSVKLKFLNVPLEVNMSNIGGTTWMASLSPKDLKKLAVSGSTINYEAHVEAKNDKGQLAVSNKPITLAIKAPDLSKSPS